jgi:hypothetical protein
VNGELASGGGCPRPAGVSAGPPSPPQLPRRDQLCGLAMATRTSRIPSMTAHRATRSGLKPARSWTRRAGRRRLLSGQGRFRSAPWPRIVTVRRAGTPPSAVLELARGGSIGSAGTPTGAVRGAAAGRGAGRRGARGAGSRGSVERARFAGRPPSIACSRACRRRAGSRRAKASSQTSSSIRMASGGTDARGRGIDHLSFLRLRG